MGSSVFPGILSTVSVATTGALTGDGTSGNKLAVSVDGSSVLVNGSNQIGALIHQSVTALNNAQILTLPTVPVNIVSAPGSGYVIIGFASLGSPSSATLSLDWTADYGNINADASFKFKVGTGGSQSWGSPNDMSGFLAGGADTFWPIPNQDLKSSQQARSDFTDYDNKAMTLSVLNAANGNFNGGHINNVLTVTVIYLLYQISTGLFV